MNNIIENNIAMYSDIGIFLDWSKNNFIRKNTVNNNDIHGLSLEWFSDNNKITDNKASNNIVGMSYMWSSNNLAENNTLTQNNLSTNLEWSSNNNILRNNTMRSNNYGVSVAWSSQNNTLTGNWIDSNALLGMYLRDSPANLIYNNYIANSENAWDNSANKWNISKTAGTNIIGGSYLGGNYWSDYSGKDLDGDRLGDTKLPYNTNITVGGDYRPLTTLGSMLPLVYVSPDYQKASVGSNFTVTIEVNPLGNYVYAASYNLSFDPTRLEALSQTKGPFLTRDGASSNIILNNIDNTNGILSYAETRVGTLSGTNIADTMTTLKFRVKSGSGNTSLAITQAELTDPSPALIPSTMKNGLVDIGGSQPVANCGPDKLKCENVGSPVQFDGSASYDPDGSIVNYAWNFGDGTTGSGVSSTHKYATYNWNGTAYTPFTVMLTVTDNAGLTNTDSQLVTIWIAADANGDGKVNILDAANIGLKWGSADPCADLNNDGKVNIVDAAMVGLNWGKTA
jgi:parallel beta-helix repeat protein